MPLEAALAYLSERGCETPRVVRTSAPRGPRDDGTWRVVRARPGELIVGAFPDGEPQRET